MDNSSSMPYEDFYQLLMELAMDLHWSWSHTTDKIWRELDPVLWELTHNPYVVLQTVSRERICQLLNDPFVRQTVEELVHQKRQATVAPAWFQRSFAGAPLSGVAYFSMEFMLSEALPIYSGGLGNVAGDHLKTASDLGVPLTGIGLLYQQGYSRQVIEKDGRQQYLFPYNDPGQLPIAPLRQPNGEWLRIEVRLPGYSLWLRTWKVQVGRVLLLLLDSNDAANFPVHRSITSELYGGGSELRLMQELILGIGGWRLLKALGLQPEVCHLNEGHAAFVVLERAFDFMRENETSFEVALNATRCGNVFTTHTATGAGFDRFDPNLIAQYLGHYIREHLKIGLPEFLALGRQNADDASEKFNTAYLAIRGSGFVNGVSKLHGAVSHQLFAPLFPRWPLNEVPVGHITNGVHMPTWDSPEADELWTEACGKDRWLGTVENLEQNIHKLSDARLWKLRTTGEERFIAYIRNRYARQQATAGMPLSEIKRALHVFSPDVLTLGFARRFVRYKRPNLMLQDPERLRRILSNTERPVQLILAGKAHPQDAEGQGLIQEWISFIHRYGLQDVVIFLSDYDMLLTEHLVQGVDLWINTPQRPWEACGTSGMKVLVNGGLNVSELDGWWDEAYQPELGWAIGNRHDFVSEAERDATEAAQLYDVLEQQIIPEFYTRNKEGIPEAWINRMRKSMARLTPVFSANRMVRQYTEQYYLPAARAYTKRAAGKGALARQITDWKYCTAERWKELRFGALQVQTGEGLHRFMTEVYLGKFQLQEIEVQLYADGLNGGEPVRQVMEPEAGTVKNAEVVVYTTAVPDNRAATDFTPRIMPVAAGVSLPLEASFILWHH